MAVSSNIIYNLSTKQELREILEKNESFVFIKIGSRTCPPCRKISPLIIDAFEIMPLHVTCICIDIDESIELFSFFKSKGWCSSIPSLLCYKMGNLSYKPDHVYNGADVDEINKILSLVKNKDSLDWYSNS